MDAINERMIELRKACKLNQAQFAKVLGLSRSGVADIETGRRSVTDRHLLMLEHWDAYNVNIEWLRTGKGEMFLPAETDALETIRQQYHLTDAQFSFVSHFLRLPESDKDVFFNFFSSVFNGVEPRDTIQDCIERELSSYRNELEIEASQAGGSSVSGTTDGNTKKEA